MKRFCKKRDLDDRTFLRNPESFGWKVVKEEGARRNPQGSVELRELNQEGEGESSFENMREANLPGVYLEHDMGHKAYWPPRLYKPIYQLFVETINPFAPIRSKRFKTRVKQDTADGWSCVADIKPKDKTNKGLTDVIVWQAGSKPR